MPRRDTFPKLTLALGLNPGVGKTDKFFGYYYMGSSVVGHRTLRSSIENSRSKFVRLLRRMSPGWHMSSLEGVEVRGEPLTWRGGMLRLKHAPGLVTLGMRRRNYINHLSFRIASFGNLYPFRTRGFGVVVHATP